MVAEARKEKVWRGTRKDREQGSGNRNREQGPRDQGIKGAGNRDQGTRERGTKGTDSYI
jgi:hypothetical protein